MPQPQPAQPAQSAGWERFVFDADPASPQEVKRIPLCRSGRFFRIDQGRFSVTLDQLKAMRRNAIERGVKIPLKLTHENNTEAIGWIDPHSLTIERGGRGYYFLYGNATLTLTPEKIEELRRSRSQYYISPEIVWQTHRMADSEYGAAGEPVGPMLVGAAAVLDPFFALPPVQFARALRRAPSRQTSAQRYSMYSSELIDQIKAILVENGMPEEKAADALLKIMALESAPAAAEEPAPEEMAAKPEEMAAASTLAASLGRIGAAFGLKGDITEEALVSLARTQGKQIESMAARLSALEATEQARQREAREALFAQYKREGRLRYADEKEARALLDQSGVDAFRAAFGRVPALTEQSAPAAPAKLPTAADVLGTGDATRVSDEEIKAYQAKNPGLTYRAALRELSREKNKAARPA